MSPIRRISVPDPFDLAASVSAVAGPGGSTSGFRDGVHYRASRNDDGEVQLALRREGGEVVAEAWGTGAAAELESASRLLGLTMIRRRSVRHRDRSRSSLGATADCILARRAGYSKPWCRPSSVSG